jgi:spermidine synthase
LTARFGERIAAGYYSAFDGVHLYSEQSSFQKVDVYEHEYFGRVLALDDLIQTTEQDEFCYHEMLVHPSLASRDSVDRVLIIGGGDGGTLRHALMHAANEAVMCEIDEAVVRVSREYLPALAGEAFDDARTKLVIDDGAAFVARCKDAFDAIIVDSTDPIGAATVLIGPEFYEACRKALKPDGVLVAQTGSPYYQVDEFRTAVANMSAVFGTVEPYLGVVPTYPGVMWSYTAGTDGVPVSSSSADEIRERLDARGIATRYYTPELHAGAFAVPAFAAALADTARVSPVPGR